MYKALAPYAIGVKAGNLREAIAAAKKGGFGGVEINPREVADLVEKEGPDTVNALFAKTNIKPAGFGLPFEWRKDAADWRRGVEELPRLAKAAAAIGATRTFTWVLSASDEMPLQENRRFHIERFRPIAEILGEHGIRFGMEFLGPKTLRDGKKYPFIHTMADMLEMGREIGENVGILLDSWHWYTSGGTVEEIRALRPEQVVYVHVNDAPPYIPVDEQIDSVRRVPGATGIIDIAGFLRALRTIGYDGPITPEPFDKDLAELDTDTERLHLVGYHMSTIFDRAGIVPGPAEKTLTGVRASIIAENTVRFESFELPKKPKGAQVVVEMERTIISAGTELANLTGLDTDTRVPGKWCYYPWRPGYGGVGRIVAVGPDAPTDLKPGKRGYGFFNHASHAVVDANSQICVPVPEKLDATTAVLARMGGVAISAFQRARVSLGDTVVIIGLGLVGNLAGQFFLNAGQRVIGLDLSPRRRALAEQVGFTATLDPEGLMELSGQPTEAKLVKAAKALIGGPRPPVVVEAVGDTRIIEQAVHLVSDNGQLIMLGTPRAPYQSDCTVTLKRAHFHSVSIVGAMEWMIPLLRKNAGTGVSTEGNTHLILRMIVSGALQVEPLCSHVLPAGDLARAYEGLLNEKDTFLGVVLDWQNFPAPEATY